MTEVEKALRVWTAAFPKAEPPHDEMLAQLGKGLARAAEWYWTAKGPQPPPEAETRRRPSENDLLESIEKLAGRLAHLLAGNPAVLQRICAEWPLPLDVLDAAQPGIAALADAARAARIVETPDETVTRRGAASVLKDKEKFGSPEQLFIRRVAAAYEKAGERPGISRDGHTGDLGGPFVRFVQEAASQFGVPKPPSAETIKEALSRRKQG